jgi:hypothetical protein
MFVGMFSLEEPSRARDTLLRLMRSSIAILQGAGLEPSWAVLLAKGEIAPTSYVWNEADDKPHIPCSYDIRRRVARKRLNYFTLKFWIHSRR